MDQDFTKGLADFLFESNKLERINSVRPEEIDMAEQFIQLPDLTLRDMGNAVNVFTLGVAQLRAAYGMDVRLSTGYEPPGGGPVIRNSLISILGHIKVLAPYWTHIEFESLHPYTDGNGRVGRLLWLWQMVRRRIWDPQTPFAVSFYYQALEARS